MMLDRVTKEIDHGFVECPEIVGLATGDEIFIHNYLFVDPVCSGVAKIGLKRWP